MTVQTTILNAIESAAIATLSSSITHIAVGTGTTTPSVTNTQLTNEIYRESVFTTSTTSNTYTTALFLDVAEANGNVIGEIGAFTSSSGPYMASHNLTIQSTKSEFKEMFFDIKFTVTASSI